MNNPKNDKLTLQCQSISIRGNTAIRESEKWESLQMNLFLKETLF